MTTAPTLDEMLDGAAGGRTTVAPGWGQGRATYGGLVAAMMLARARAVCADDARTLRSASVVFVGPVAPGDVTVDATLLRAGGSATTVDVKLVQDRTVRGSMLVVFGADRAGAIAFAAAARNTAPTIAAPDTLQAVPHIPGVTPDFIEHVELRYASGGLPLTGAAEPDFGGWFRFRVPPTQLGERELLALVDAWPPAVVTMFSAPTPVSTMTWTYEPVASPVAGAVDRPDALWQYDVRTHVARDGYTQASARVWDERGELRALSSQTVTYFG